MTILIRRPALLRLLDFLTSSVFLGTQMVHVTNQALAY